jgi:hypothetical protein
MALFLGLTLFHHLIDGFRNHDLRQHVTDLLGVSVAEYTSNQMTYDLRRLRLKGLIHRPRSAWLPYRCLCAPAAHPDRWSIHAFRWTGSGWMCHFHSHLLLIYPHVVKNAAWLFVTD